MKKKVLIVLLFVVSVFSFNSIDNILSFKFKDGIIQPRNLYKHKNNSIDVLILGSSHAYMDINTQTLFDDYGIASYIFGGSVQTFWNSYYYLRETLKTQKPKLVVLEGMASGWEFKYYDPNIRQSPVKNTFGLKNSLLKIQAKRASFSRTEFDNHLLEYRIYHSRYKELNNTDRKGFYQKGMYRNNKGYIPNFVVKPLTLPVASEVEANGENSIHEKEEKYFKRIVKLCKKENIPLMVIIAPWRIKSGYQKYYNSLKKLSEKYSVTFINYNYFDLYQKIGFDFSNDFFDAGHLNIYGASKFSKILGQDIKDIFSIPDRRGDKEYETWAISSEILKNMPINKAVTDAKDPDDYIKSIKENKNITLYINTISSTREIAGKDFFKKMDIDGKPLKDGRLYEFANGSLREISDNKINWKHVIPLFDEKVIFQQKKNYSDKMTSVNSLFYNGKEYINDQKGTYVVAYDTLSREIVAVRQIICKKDGNDCVLTLVKK